MRNKLVFILFSLQQVPLSPDCEWSCTESKRCHCAGANCDLRLSQFGNLPLGIFLSVWAQDSLADQKWPQSVLIKLL